MQHRPFHIFFQIVLFGSSGSSGIQFWKIHQTETNESSSDINEICSSLHLEKTTKHQNTPFCNKSAILRCLPKNRVTAMTEQRGHFTKRRHVFHRSSMSYLVDRQIQCNPGCIGIPRWSSCRGCCNQEPGLVDSYWGVFLECCKWLLQSSIYEMKVISKKVSRISHWFCRMYIEEMLKKVKVFLSYLAFIVSYGALSALPPWVAATGTLFVFTVWRAEHRTSTWRREGTWEYGDMGMCGDMIWWKWKWKGHGFGESESGRDMEWKFWTVW